MEPAGTWPDLGRVRAALDRLPAADAELLRLAAWEGDVELGGRIEAFVSAALSGDRLAVEAVASESFGGDACA